MEKRKLIRLGKTLKRISKPQLEGAFFCTNGSSKNHGFIKNAWIS